jgi:hypothetical protein
MVALLATVISNDHPFTLYFLKGKGIMATYISSGSFKKPFAHNQVVFLS